VSRLCDEIDDKVKAFLACPIEGEYLWIDAVKVRQNGRIVSVASASLGETLPGPFLT
jgi:putative transposase